MIQLKDKLILSDVDGVLLNWEYSFTIWMQEHGFVLVPGGEYYYELDRRFNIDKDQVMKLVKIFNESAAIGFLPALRDAVYYVKKLHERYGFVFHAITSLSLEPNAGKLREMNLHKLFGESVFEKVICLETNADKYDALLPYQNSGCYWIEDKVSNAETGVALGLNSILMEHGFNMHHYHPDITLVKNWKEIYDLVAANIVQ